MAISHEQGVRFAETLADVVLQMQASDNWLLTLANKFLAVYRLGIEEGKRQAQHAQKELT